MPAVVPAASCRNTLGGIPTSSVKRELKVPSDEHPTAKQTSVTLRSPRSSSAIARSMRRVMRVGVRALAEGGPETPAQVPG